VSKILSGFIAMRISGFGNAAGVAAGLMTVPQLSATLAAAAIGKEMGILKPEFFNAIIILSLVTTLPVPSAVRFVVTKWNVSSKEEQNFKIPQVVSNDELL
jgi:Kef-type K+ transport system membrane component KefB